MMAMTALRHQALPPAAPSHYKDKQLQQLLPPPLSGPRRCAQAITVTSAIR